MIDNTKTWKKLKKAYKKRLNKLTDLQIKNGTSFMPYLLTFLAMVRDYNILNTDMRDERDPRSATEEISKDDSAIFKDIFNEEETTVADTVAEEDDKIILNDFTEELINALHCYSISQEVFEKLQKIKLNTDMSQQELLTNNETKVLLNEFAKNFGIFWTFLESNLLNLENWQNV